VGSEFISFAEQIPMNCIAQVRVSDNVLEDEDWAVAELIITEGIVRSYRLIKHGIYQLDDMVGMTTEEVAVWTSYDPVGDHPENYYEIRVV
jgi:hypothetical protein